MTTKDTIRRLLEQNLGLYVSGAELARQLNLSRNAVWRAVKTLQEDGYVINAVPNRGYCLERAADTISPDSFSRWLTVAKDRINIHVFPTITSTNTVLKEMAEKGAPEGTILIAGEQTAGRGRMGRSFYSPSGTGVYLSMLMRPTFSPAQSLYITTAAAVAVAEAIETVTLQKTRIKWVNDVYLDGKKACGILTEASFDMESKRLAYTVCGIGINMRVPEGGYPEELSSIVTSVFENSAYDVEKRNRIIAEVISRFWQFYEHLTEKTFLRGYQERSLLQGKSVYVINGNEKRPATALEIDDEFHLHVRFDDGSEEFLKSGEVSVKARAID